MVDRVDLAHVDGQADQTQSSSLAGWHEAGKKKPRSAGFKSRRKRP
jgi:hypothetical protein